MMQQSLANSINSVEGLQATLGLFSGHRPDVHGPQRGLVGSIELGRVAEISFAKITHNAVQMHRGVPPVYGPASGKVLMWMQLAERSIITQGGVEASLDAGDIALVDSDREFSTTFTGMSTQILVYLPAAEVLAETHSARLRKLSFHSGKGGLTTLALPLLTSLIADPAALDESDGLCARRILVELGRGLIAKQVEADLAKQELLPNRRIREFIAANLAQPDLDPGAIARGCGISVRRLHRIFAETGRTACEWLRNERLTRCYNDLRDERFERHSVTDIAFRWGFNDSAHFSRVFRQSYDRTPSDVRRQAQSMRTIKTLAILS